MQIKANAKINLSLDVIGKLPNGYHEVSMVMQEVDFGDIVDITPEPKGQISVSVTGCDLPDGEGNIAYRAAKLFYEKTAIEGGCTIALTKHIPVCAGLGGGSADGAAVLKGLNLMYGEPLDTPALMELGLRLGADVPFCIMGGTAHAGGVGQVLTPIKSSLSCYAAIIKPDIDISTPLAYKAIDETVFPHPDTGGCIEAVAKGDLSLLSQCSGNAFEYVSRPVHKEIDLIKNHLISQGAAFAMMSGSGPSVFGLFENENDAIRAFEAYKGSFGGGGVGRVL